MGQKGKRCLAPPRTEWSPMGMPVRRRGASGRQSGREPFHATSSPSQRRASSRGRTSKAAPSSCARNPKHSSRSLGSGVPPVSSSCSGTAPPALRADHQTIPTTAEEHISCCGIRMFTPFPAQKPQRKKFADVCFDGARVSVAEIKGTWLIKEVSAGMLFCAFPTDERRSAHGGDELNPRNDCCRKTPEQCNRPGERSHDAAVVMHRRLQFSYRSSTL